VRCMCGFRRIGIVYSYVCVVEFLHIWEPVDPVICWGLFFQLFWFYIFDCDIMFGIFGVIGYMVSEGISHGSGEVPC